MQIISARVKNDIDVKFLDENGYVKRHSSYTTFKLGQIKNPYDRSVFGVGYLGEGKYKTAIQKQDLTQEYEAWKGILERCYYDDKKHPAYYGICMICKEWENYQNFAAWYEREKYECEGRLHIDKDILCPNCNIYSPETCLLIPQRLNALFICVPNNRDLPCSMRKVKSGYSISYQGKSLGIYGSIDKAYQIYANKKEKRIKEAAIESKDMIPKKVFDALMNYKVLIENDKNYKRDKWKED